MSMQSKSKSGLSHRLKIVDVYLVFARILPANLPPKVFSHWTTFYIHRRSHKCNYAVRNSIVEYDIIRLILMSSRFTSSQQRVYVTVTIDPLQHTDLHLLCLASRFYQHLYVNYYIITIRQSKWKHNIIHIGKVKNINTQRNLLKGAIKILKKNYLLKYLLKMRSIKQQIEL